MLRFSISENLHYIQYNLNLHATILLQLLFVLYTNNNNNTNNLTVIN